MIYLNKKEESNFHIDGDLVINYKRLGDSYLVNVKHNLTRQLVYYVLYEDLQLINNSFFVIIDKLLNNEYIDIKEIKDDYSRLIRDCDSFVRNSEIYLSSNVYDTVIDSLKRLKLLILKLISIAEKYCYIDNNKGLVSNNGTKAVSYKDYF